MKADEGGPRPGEILGRRVLVDTPRVRFERVTERLPNGHVEDRDWLVHPGAAVLVPMLDDGRFLVLRQYRSTVGRYIWEFPAGTLEPGEEPRAAALRELEEETGFAAGSAELILDFYPAPGVTDERMFCYLAKDLTASEQNLDPGECLEVHRFSLDELAAMLSRGELIDGKTIAAVGYLLAFGPEARPAHSSPSSSREETP